MQATFRTVITLMVIAIILMVIALILSIQKEMAIPLYIIVM